MPEKEKRSSFLTRPLTTAPSIYSRKLANRIDNPQGVGSYGSGLLAGMLTGAGDLASEMTSPLSLGLSTLGMPWLRGAKQLTSLGNIAHRIPSPNPGVGPSVNIPELVARGSEGIYNTGRSIYSPARKTAEDLAYEVVRRGGDLINRNIGGSFNVADMMRKTNAARRK